MGGSYYCKYRSCVGWNRAVPLISIIKLFKYTYTQVRHKIKAITCVLVVDFFSTRVTMVAWHEGHVICDGSGPTGTTFILHLKIRLIVIDVFMT